MICRKKNGGQRACNKNIRRSSYRKGHQLYILLSFDSVRAIEIHHVARATSCLACALEMRSSNGRERPSTQFSKKALSSARVTGIIYEDKDSHIGEFSTAFKTSKAKQSFKIGAYKYNSLHLKLNPKICSDICPCTLFLPRSALLENRSLNGTDNAGEEMSL